MKKLHGLYAITSQSLCASEAVLLTAVKAALRGGAALIQYRDKWNDPAARENNARRLLQLCRTYGAPLIINDDVALAARIGADGAHVGAADAPLVEARRRLGIKAIIGVSCGNSLDRALAAQASGADYIALGRFFPSRTKPDAPQAQLELLERVRHMFPQLPICTIGGITPGNAAQLIAAGADMVAAVEGVFGTDDIVGAVQAYRCRF